MERLGLCISDMRTAVNAIERRLAAGGMLDPTSAVVAADDGAIPPKQVRSPHGARIDGHSDDVFGLTSQLNELLDRLAV